MGLDDLHDYGAARGLSFVPLDTAANRPGGLPAYDAALVDRLEGELEQARTSLSTLEEEAARQRLIHVESELFAHPHLPQAAFLMAEYLALKIQASPSAPQVPELRRRRAALEGPRSPAFGEPDSPGTTAAPAMMVDVSGLAPADELEVDGQVLPTTSARQVSLAAGLHHFRVLRADRPVYAGFHELAADQQVLGLPVPRLIPCSHEDLSPIRPELAAAGAPLPLGVACQRWALVRPQAEGVSVALCGQRGCGPFVHWQRRPKPAPFTPITIDRQRLPGWAGFAIAGAGAALATSFLLWQTGALDRGQRAATTLEYGGLNP
jgi:hypothetical protein